MRSLLITAAAITVTLALTGCPGSQQQPVPGPRSSAVSGLSPNTAARQAPADVTGSRDPDPPAEINWFQGTLEEAFTRRPRTEDRPRLRY